jgi:predicted  nucleic acid-binding Zn-ribbon protein
MGAALKTEMAAEKRRRIDAEKKGADAEKKAADAENKAADAVKKAADLEKHLQDYRNSTEAKLKKSAEFYASQKELLELQLAQVAAPE